VVAENLAQIEGIEGEVGSSFLVDLGATFCRGCDLILAEGYKRSPYDKIWVLGPKDLDVPPEMAGVQLVVGNAPAPGRISRDNLDHIVAWVLAWRERRLGTRNDLIGAVLAGGSSRRMGYDKILLKVGGHSVLGRLCELLADRVGHAIIVGHDAEEIDVPGCAEWCDDVIPGLGPMGGVLTALRRVNHRIRGVCIVACDMPALNGELLDTLLANRNPDAPATVFQNPDGTMEPLVGVYEAPALESLEEAVRSRRLHMQEWLRSVGAFRLSAPRTLMHQLTNINTPKDLKILEDRSGANKT
jgi:molybdopterin-guanine dinucleotide biosynthesis protein A